MKKLLTAILITTASSVAFADDHKKGGYGGFGVGATYVELDYGGTNDVAYGADVFGGYRFNPYIAAEVSIGGFKYDDFDAKGAGISVSVLPIAPISDTLDAYLSFDYSLVYLDNYWGNVVDGFGVGAGMMWHNESMFVRWGISTALDGSDGPSTASIGAGVSVAFKF